jgi:HK97 gp10 family phage protein
VTNSVWVEGIEELNKVAADLATAGQRVGAKGSTVLRAYAHLIEGTGKQFAPRDTGATANSIGVDFTGDGRSNVMGADIGPTTSYSPFVEWGTIHMAPRAFMGPALDRHSPGYLAAVAGIADPLDT